MDLVVQRVEASSRRLFGRLVKLVLKLLDLVMGAVSHQAFTGLSLLLQACDTAGALP